VLLVFLVPVFSMRLVSVLGWVNGLLCELVSIIIWWLGVLIVVFVSMLSYYCGV